MASQLDGPYVGTVKSYNAQKGYGFLQGPESHAAYGKDILIPGSSLPDPTQGLTTGASLSFKVCQGKNGPIAVELVPISGDIRTISKRPNPSRIGAPLQKRARHESADDGWYVGRIKSFNPIKGWGFIASDQMQQLFGKDIMVLRADILDGVEPQTNLEVWFQLGQGRTDKIAKNVSAAHETTGFPPSPQHRIIGLAPSFRPSRPNTRTKAEHADGVSSALISDERYFGQIKSYNSEKGWGFIASGQMQEIYGKDMMVLRVDLPNGFTQPGGEVSFQLAQGRQGLIAKNLELLEDVAPGRSDDPLLGGEVYSGKIKSYNPVKGWGFITSPEMQTMYGKDIMVLAHDLVDGGCEIGSTVTFRVAPGRAGDIAKDVRMSGRTALYSGSSAHDTAQRYRGTIKSFNATKGFGFVESLEMQSMFGKDIMVLKSELPAGFVNPGQDVAFCLEEGKTGMLATRLQLVNSAPANASKGRGKIGAPANASKGRGKDGPQRYRGEIKSFNAVKGWGFVTSPQILAHYGKDIMIRADQLQGNADAGTQISFVVEEGLTGYLATKVRF